MKKPIMVLLAVPIVLIGTALFSQLLGSLLNLIVEHTPIPGEPVWAYAWGVLIGIPLGLVVMTVWVVRTVKKPKETVASNNKMHTIVCRASASHEV